MTESSESGALSLSSAAQHIDFHLLRRTYVAFIAHSIAISLHIKFTVISLNIDAFLVLFYSAGLIETVFCKVIFYRTSYLAIYSCTLIFYLFINGMTIIFYFLKYDLNIF